jgi:MoaA/NifB/PqqE/SkfB family radical SAM enzyme
MLIEGNFLWQILRSKLKRTPFKLNFAVTYCCNSRCQTCNIWKFYRDGKRDSRELTLDEIRRLFRNSPTTICWLCLVGGEPFLRNDLVEIVQAALEDLPSLSVISLDSNGLLMERTLEFLERIKHQKKTIFYLNFSLDGPEELHDQIRGIPGAFKKTWNTYLAARDLLRNNGNFRVGLEATVSTLNMEAIPDFIRELTSRKHHLMVTFAHSGYLYGSDGNNQFVPIGQENRIAEITRVMKKRLSFLQPHNLIFDVYLNKVAGYYREPSRRILPCEALKSSLAINPQGLVTPCFLWDQPLGTLDEVNYEVMRIWNGDKAEETRKKIESNECPNCWCPCEAFQSIISSRLPVKGWKP